jgi:hypothetical protein
LAFRWGGIGIVETNANLLSGPAEVLLRQGGQHLAIGTRQGRVPQRAGPQPAAENHVELGGVDDEPRDKRDPEHKSEDEPEHAVNSRVAQLVAYEVRTESLQRRPSSSGDDGARQKAPRPHHRGRQHPVGEDKLRASGEKRAGDG